LESVIQRGGVADTLSVLPNAFVEAGPVGKLVMVLLAIASVWSWILILEGLFTLFRLKMALKQTTKGTESPQLAPLLTAGRESAKIAIVGESPGEFRHRIVEAMNRRAQDLLTEAEGGLPNLAVIASVSPFVGLFGTVYGIMSSFANIAEAKDTSLAVVAPGIAEALAATAWGLAAAIPALVAYNRLGAALFRAGQKLSHFIEERAVQLAAERKPAS